MKNIEPRPNLKHLLSSIRWSQREVISPRQSNFEFVGSGKSAIALILKYLSLKDPLKNKMSPIYMSPWLGTWVYFSVLEHGFPIAGNLKASELSKGGILFCYHQYGFPQKMEYIHQVVEDKKLILVEDCAHAIDFYSDLHASSMKSRFRFFSFSKFTFCYSLGGVQSHDHDFIEYVKEEKINSTRISRYLQNSFKFYDSLHQSDGALSVMMRNSIYANYARQHAPSKLGMRIIKSYLQYEIMMRNANYLALYSELQPLGLIDEDLPLDVTPYAVPIKISSDKVAEFKNKLGALKINVYPRYFDVNRNMFDSNYQLRVFLPIHSQITSSDLDCIINISKGYCKLL